MASCESRMWASSRLPFTQGQGTIAQESIRIPKMSRHNNLLSFLAVVQYFGFDFLGMQWDQDRGPIGFGANAEVRTTFVSDHREFAYKRHRALQSSSDSMKLDCESHDHDEYINSRERIFNELVSEITILGHPSIRYHHNFVHVEGVCWETPSGDTEIWPVLVLEKANLGDLWSFGRSLKGQQLAIKDRLLLCMDVANALLALHENGMVHGDVKPQNVLISEETHLQKQKGLIYAKMADFGYAGWNMDRAAELPIYLPQSKPWDAPEYHHRGFQIEQAKKLDVYSFGVLCFWFLFHDKSLKGDLKFPESIKERQRPAFEWQGNILAWLKEMEQLKRDAHLISLMRNFVLEESSLNSRDKNNLEIFFFHVLAQNPQQRRICLDKLSAITGQECMAGPISQDLEGRSLDHASVKFRVTDSYVSLMYGEYKVIKHIAFRLRMEALYASHKTFQESAAFQYAICCKVGFGVPANEDEAQEWLHLSGKSDEELASELAVIRRNLKYQHIYKDGDLANMSAFGWLTRRSRWSEGDDSPDKIFERELNDIVNCFGSDNSLVLNLNIELARLFLQQHRLEEAEAQLVQMLENEAKNPAWRSLRELVSEERLSIWQRRLQETAGPLVLNRPSSKSCSSEFRRILELVRGTRLAVRVDLAGVYVARKKWKEAEILFIDVRESLLTYRTEDDHIVLQHTSMLGHFYYNMERYADAERVFKYICNISEYKYGKQHPDSLYYQNWLAYIHMTVGNHSAAEVLLLQLQSQYIRVYEASSPKVRTCNRQLINLYRLAGRYREAENIATELLSTCKERSGCNEDTIEAMYSLGKVLAEQDSLAESERLLREVLQSRLKLPENDDSCNSVRADLGYVLRKTGKSAEAESILQHVLLQDHPIPEPLSVFSAAQELAGIYESQGRHEEYEQLFVARIVAHTDTLGEYHVATMKWKQNLVWFYLRRDRPWDAERLQLNLRQTLEFTPTTSRASHLDCDWVLANIYCWQGRFNEAESLIGHKIQELEHVFGAGSRQWRSAIFDLMLIRKSQRRWEEASIISTKYLASYKGQAKKDPWRIVMNQHRASILVMQRRFLEAAPYVLGSLPWPNTHWADELGYFEVSEVDGGLYPTRSHRLKNLVLKFLALLLFSGYWSGLYSIYSRLVHLILTARLKRVRTQKCVQKAVQDMSEPVDRPKSFFKNA